MTTAWTVTTRHLPLRCRGCLDEHPVPWTNLRSHRSARVLAHCGRYCASCPSLSDRPVSRLLDESLAREGETTRPLRSSKTRRADGSIENARVILRCPVDRAGHLSFHHFNSRISARGGWPNNSFTDAGSSSSIPA